MHGNFSIDQFGTIVGAISPIVGMTPEIFWYKYYECAGELINLPQTSIVASTEMQLRFVSHF